MATRTVITGKFYAAPDHLHVHTYNVNDQYTIGSFLMPQPLSTLLVSLGKATEDSTALSAADTTRNTVSLSTEFVGGAESQPWDSTDPRWAAHIASWHRG